MPDLYCSSFLPQFAVLLDVFVHVPTIWECSPTKVTVTTRNMLFGRGSRLFIIELYFYFYCYTVGEHTNPPYLCVPALGPRGHEELAKKEAAQAESQAVEPCGAWFLVHGGRFAIFVVGKDGELEELLASMLNQLPLQLDSAELPH